MARYPRVHVSGSCPFITPVMSCAVSWILNAWRPYSNKCAKRRDSRKGRALCFNAQFSSAVSSPCSSGATWSFGRRSSTEKRPLRPPTELGSLLHLLHTRASRGVLFVRHVCRSTFAFVSRVPCPCCAFGGATFSRLKSKVRRFKDKLIALFA